MDPTTAGASAGLIMVLSLLVVVLVVCWIILPFAVIGTKSLLRQILAEQRKTNELLRAAAQGPGRSPREPSL